MISLFSDPAGTRTQDPYIKSVLLYQLSYGILSFLKVMQRYEKLLCPPNVFSFFCMYKL